MASTPNDRAGTEPGAGNVVHQRGPAGPRWTHVALPCHDIDRSIAWYTKFTPLELLDRREDSDGCGAWLGHPDQLEFPFVLVLVSFFRDQHRGPQPTLAPFAHLGIEVESRRRVEEGLARARS